MDSSRLVISPGEIATCQGAGPAIVPLPGADRTVTELTCYPGLPFTQKILTHSNLNGRGSGLFLLLSYDGQHQYTKSRENPWGWKAACASGVGLANNRAAVVVGQDDAYNAGHGDGCGDGPTRREEAPSWPVKRR